MERQRALAFSPRRVDVGNGTLRSVRGSQERAQLVCADVIGCPVRMSIDALIFALYREWLDRYGEGGGVGEA